MTTPYAPVASAPVSSALENERRALEPSMEEILASIRKIISDDDALPLTRPAASASVKPVIPVLRSVDTKVTPFAPPAAAVKSPEAQGAEIRNPAAKSADQSEFSALQSKVTGMIGALNSERNASEAAADHASADRDMDTLIAQAMRAPPVNIESQDYHLRPAITPDSQPAESKLPVADVITSEPAATFIPRAAFTPQIVMKAPERGPRFSDPRPVSAPLSVKENDAPELPLVSSATNVAVTSAFEALSASVMLTSSDMVDGHVRDLLRPMLKQWLDDNLPVMVEKLIRAEIERVARGQR